MLYLYSYLGNASFQPAKSLYLPFTKHIQFHSVLKLMPTLVLL